MRLQIYMSPVLGERLYQEASEKHMEPRELADQILKDYFGIKEGEEDYQTSLSRVMEEIDQFLADEEKVKKANGTFTLIDFENFRRRNAAEREQLSTFVTADVVGKFLKVLDNFERAEQSVKTTNDMSAIVAGMEKIKRQFEQAFKELEVEEIPAEGQKFNPELHEAVMRGQNPDLEDESIEQVFEKGYRLRNKIIRHSKVKVISND